MDKKSCAELNLANSYESRAQDEKGIVLFKKTISRADRLTDVILLLMPGLNYLQGLSLIYLVIKPIQDRLQFISNMNIPTTTAQAILYHYIIYMSYPYYDTISTRFLFHISLLKSIKKDYRAELTNSQKCMLEYFESNIKNKKIGLIPFTVNKQSYVEVSVQ